MHHMAFAFFSPLSRNRCWISVLRGVLACRCYPNFVKPLTKCTATLTSYVESERTTDAYVGSNSVTAIAMITATRDSMRC